MNIMTSELVTISVYFVVLEGFVTKVNRCSKEIAFELLSYLLLGFWFCFGFFFFAFIMKLQ